MTIPDRTTPSPLSSKHRLGKAALDIPMRALKGGSRRPDAPSDDLVLPPAVDAPRREIATAAGRLSYYVASTPGDEPTPLLLVHSINAAGSAYEMGPLFRFWRERRPVYALDLPGFGFSERSERPYTPRLMTDAILAMLDEIARIHGDRPIDVMALSLSCEFLARAASERPALFRTVALVSPTGFDRRGPRKGPPGSTRAMPALHKAFTLGLWRRQFFKLLSSRVSIRYFLEKTWGSKAIDEGLLDYDYRTTHQPGAEHAPFCFISGFMFSNDVTRLYEALTLPVWMIHGVRGDFTDYTQEGAFRTRPNWTIETFQTGALPHFEEPDAVNRSFAAFLAANRQAPAVP